METTRQNRGETLDREDRTEVAPELESPELTPGDTFEPTLEGDSPESAEAGPLERVDRFRLEQVLGSGGMGTVYAGWDEKLQRQVALKFLRRTTNPDRSEKRFYREAQGLARISHPNVVPVYDVGRWNERVWIAMEYVPGQTLGEWAAAAPRSQAELLEKWLDVGRGLAAIHDAGLIHRDIKPSNILVGNDGRVRIVDFGLVKAADTRRDSGESETITPESGSQRRWSSSNSQLNTNLTEARGFLGTAGYAAPEQQDGRSIDACSDQYSFCVALWEALCGARPPRQERDRNGLVPLPVGVRLPKRLHRALSRGLALEPRARFGDMHGLLAALTPPQRRWLAPTVAAVVTALVGSCLNFVLTPDDPDPDEDPCAQVAAPIDAIWTEERRQSLALQVGEAASTRATRLVDAWTEVWSNAATTSCKDVPVRGLWSEQAQERRATCLAHSLDSFEAFMLAVDQHTVTKPQQLIEWLGVLRDPEACLGEAVLRSNYDAVAEEFSEEIATLRGQLIELGVSGPRDHQQRIRVAEHVRDRAATIGDKLLLGQAELALGILHTQVYDIPVAKAELGRALDIGTLMHDAELAADAWSALFQIACKTELDRQKAAWILARQDALFAEVPPSPRRRARLLVDRAQYLALDSNLEQAVATLREAQQLYEEAGLSATWERANATHTLGWVLTTLGRNDEALAAYDAARKMEVDSTDPLARPVSEANILRNEAITLCSDGQYAAARTRALSSLEHALAQQGPHGAMVASAHVVIAAACQGLGDIDCVRTHAEQADKISLLAVGPTHLSRTDVLSTVAVAAILDGRPDAAIVVLEHALAIAQRHTDADSLTVALAELNLAEELPNIGQNQRAAALAAHAFEILQQHPDRPVDIIRATLLLADLELKLQKHSAARALLEGVVSIVPSEDIDTHRTIEDLLARCKE